MCSLYLTHPRAHTHLEQWTHAQTHTHTPGAVDTVHSAVDAQHDHHVTFNKIHLFETREIILTFTNHYFANKHLNKYISIEINDLLSPQAIAV